MSLINVFFLLNRENSNFSLSSMSAHNRKRCSYVLVLSFLKKSSNIMFYNFCHTSFNPLVKFYHPMMLFHETSRFKHQR